jgi:serine/threonine protein kinase
MGNVYLSFTRGGRPIAIKVVKEIFAEDPEFRRRFRREIAAAQRVQGHYTAPVLDADPDAPTPWLATAYIAGPSLQTAVAEHGPFPPTSVFRLLAGVAEGVAALHAAGLTSPRTSRGTRRCHSRITTRASRGSRGTCRSALNRPRKKLAGDP